MDLVHHIDLVPQLVTIPGFDVVVSLLCGLKVLSCSEWEISGTGVRIMRCAIYAPYEPLYDGAGEGVVRRQC